MKILWPMLKRNTDDLDLARSAFVFHAMDDEAWTADYTEAELITFVSNLR
jgi:hypothetical protein